MALGDLPAGMDSAPSDALVYLWNEEMAWEVCTIIPRHQHRLVSQLWLLLSREIWPL